MENNEFSPEFKIPIACNNFYAIVPKICLQSHLEIQSSVTLNKTFTKFLLGSQKYYNRVNSNLLICHLKSYKIQISHHFDFIILTKLNFYQ